MRLQKQLSRKLGNKEYPKWMVTIPPKLIDILGWREGEYLECEVNNQELIIRRENIQEIEKRKEAAKKAWKTRKRTRKEE